MTSKQEKEITNFSLEDQTLYTVKTLRAEDRKDREQTARTIISYIVIISVLIIYGIIMIQNPTQINSFKGISTIVFFVFAYWFKKDDKK
jgi:hypothetical protein